MKFVKIAAIGLAAATAAASNGASAATTYNAVTDFGGSMFAYGTGVGGAFAPLPNYSASCTDLTAGLSCYNTPGGQYTFPAIGKNVSGSTLTFYTNVLPTDQLFFQADPLHSATLRFIAPTAGTYVFTGKFVRIDNSDGSGDGTFVSFGANSAFVGTTYGNAYNFSQTLALGANETVDFSQSSVGNTNNDGTGFALVITAVPEAATWAMMLAGFGLVGAGMRSRRNRSVRVTYA